MSALDECVSEFLSKEVPKGREPTKQEIAIGFSKCREKRAKLAMSSLKIKFASMHITKKLAQKKKKAQTRYAQLDTNFVFPDDEKGQFSAYFLLAGDEINGNEWGVTEEHIPENIQNFVGRPFTITSTDFFPESPYGNVYRHPSIYDFIKHKPELVQNLDPENFEDILEFQKQFAVGDISKIVFNDVKKDWEAIIKHRPEFVGRTFPPFCSPTLFMNDLTEPDDAITTFKGVNLTGLTDRPAFGSQSTFKGSCNGTLGSCTKSFFDNKSLLKTELKLTRTNMAALISTDNPAVEKVPIFKKKKRNAP